MQGVPFAPTEEQRWLVRAFAGFGIAQEDIARHVGIEPKTLRRHFRDAGWTVRPPRRVQDLQARIATAQDRLEARLGRSPRPSELAEHLDAPLSDIVEALAADGCLTPTSLDASVSCRIKMAPAWL